MSPSKTVRYWADRCKRSEDKRISIHQDTLEHLANDLEAAYTAGEAKSTVLAWAQCCTSCLVFDRVFCGNCGKQLTLKVNAYPKIAAEEKFCPDCGYAVTTNDDYDLTKWEDRHTY